MNGPVLADTSVWVEHLRRGNARMAELLAAGHIVVHDHVIGELCLGGLRGDKLAAMQSLRHSPVARHGEVMQLIAQRQLTGRGICYVDCHLLASALIGRVRLWSLDKTLHQAATSCDCALVLH